MFSFLFFFFLLRTALSPSSPFRAQGDEVCVCGRGWGEGGRGGGREVPLTQMSPPDLVIKQREE